ncbi:hypothetical protein [Mycobacterium sp. M26]|uniref:hypothetical protein n=1 Tax=Mycobacterium sp. M26 TaxID=1762962 RepID=UPI00073EAAD5|nr:hypothetical protein [Mycobacterium sp. M26]
MNKIDFQVAVGEAAQDAVWKTPHPLTHRLADDDPAREQYLREYQSAVGRQVIAAIMQWLATTSCAKNPVRHLQMR